MARRDEGGAARGHHGATPKAFASRAKPDGLFPENPPGGGSFVRGRRWLVPYSPLRALRAAKAALATAKIPRRSAPRSFQTGSMKTLAIAAPLVLGCLTSFADPLAAQPAADSGQALVIERGSDYAIVQLVTSQVRADGLTVTRTNSYTALEMGMHYLKDGNWLETQERIEVAVDGSAAYATQGPS